MGQKGYEVGVSALFASEKFDCGEGLVKIHHLVENDTKENILPLRRFRTRFK
jgi:hypothetical protein